MITLMHVETVRVIVLLVEGILSIVARVQIILLVLIAREYVEDNLHKITAVNVHLVGMIRAIKFVNNGVASV